MKKRFLAAGSGALLLFVLTGAFWIALVRLVPAGLPRSTAIVAAGVVFVFTYVGLLIARIREILAGTPRFIRNAVIAGVELVLLLLAFGAVHQALGLTDNTQAGSPVVHDFWLSVYYSVVTFTTLGYGDYYPVGVGRVLAGIQALTGYIILGVLASTAASVLSPHTAAGRAEARDRESHDG